MNRLLALGVCLAISAPLSALDNRELESLLTACAACHGDTGEGDREQGAPALAGQQAGYLARQLQGFRDGRRGGHPADLAGASMSGASVGMSDEQVHALASHYAQLPVKPRPELDTADGDPAGEVYREACGHCHGDRGEGYASLGAPRLDTLTADYLHQQMDNFATGQRGADGNDDLQSLWMQAIASHEGDREVLEQAINYIAADSH